MVPKAKTILWIKLMTLSLVMAIGCAPKSKKSEAKLNLISSMAIADINMDGGAIVYGEQLDGPGKWGNIFRPGDDVVVDMAQGVWNFSIIAYSGPTALSGLRECAVLNKINIAEEKEVIDVVISSGACGGAGVRGLLVQRCTQAEFDSGDPLANCSQADGIESYRLRLMGHRNGKPTGDFLESQCYTEATFAGSGNPKVPMGITNIRTQPFVLVGYTGTACDPGTDNFIPFQEALSIPSNGSIKSFDSGANLTLVINNDGNDLDNIAPNVLITGTSAISGNGENWINQANQSSFNFGGNCETGVTIQYFLNGAPLGSGTCTSSIMNDSFDLSGYPDTGYGATYTVEARQIDGAGNVGSSTIALRKDATLPTSGSVSSLAPVPVNTNYIPTLTPSLTINKGTDTSGSGSITYTLKEYTTGSCGGGFTTQQITEPASTFNLTLVDASTNSFRVTTTDYAGNTSLDGPCYGTDIIVDTTTPAAPTSAQLNSSITITNDNTPNVTWIPSASGDVASQEIEIYDPACASLQATVPGLSSVATTHTLSPLTNGTYSVRVVAVDNAGNRTPSACTNNTIVDTTNPTIATSISFSTPLTNLPASVTATFTPGTDNNSMNQYTVNFYNDGVCAGTIRDTITVPGAGPYTASAVNLAVDGSVDGTYKVQIISEDSAGNTNASPCSSATAVFDTTAPVAPTLGAPNWAQTSPTFSKNVQTNAFTLSGDTDNITVNVWDGAGCSGNQLDNVTGLPNSTTSRSFNFTTAGPKYYEIIAFDPAGNSNSSCSSLLDIKQGGMGLGGEYTDGFVVGNTHLYTLNAGGLEIYNVSTLEPAQINLVGKIKVPGIEPEVARKYGNFIYIFEPTGGAIHVFTTTGAGTLDSPAFVGVMNGGVSPADRAFIASSGGFIWIADSTGNVVGIDISTPGTNGTNVGSFASGGAGCTSIEYGGNNYLYLACGQNIVPVDISTPASPVPATPVDPSGTATVYNELILAGTNTLYGGGQGGGVTFSEIDITTPQTPAMTKENTDAGQILSLGNYNVTLNQVSACYADTVDYVVSQDLVPGAMPKRSSLSSGTGNKCNLALINNNEIFSLSTNGGIVRKGHSGVGAPTNDPTPHMPGNADHIAIEPGGQAAVVTRNIEGFTVLDLADKWNPRVVNEAFGTARNAVFGANSAFIAIGTSIARHGVSYGPLSFNMTADATINVTRSSQADSGMAIAHTKGTEGFVYLGHSDGHMSVVNVATNTKLYDVQVCSGAVEVVDIAVDPDNENRVFALCDAGANVEIRGFDNSDPENSFTSITGAVGAWTFADGGMAVKGIALKGNALFFANGNNGTIVYNVSTPTSPVLSTSIAGTTANSVRVAGDVLYVSIGQGGVRSWNITAPLSPTALDNITVPGTPSRANSLGLSDNSTTPEAIFQAAGFAGGIQVINIQDPANMHQ